MIRPQISLVDLVRQGRLKPGAKLIHKARRFKERNVSAAVVEGGAIRYAGKTYRSLSAAASAVTGKPADGWTFWRIAETGEQLDQLRRDLGA